MYNYNDNCRGDRVNREDRRGVYDGLSHDRYESSRERLIQSGGGGDVRRTHDERYDRQG
jgi:hypothetical protein